MSDLPYFTLWVDFTVWFDFTVELKNISIYPFQRICLVEVKTMNITTNNKCIQV